MKNKPIKVIALIMCICINTICLPSCSAGNKTASFTVADDGYDIYSPGTEVGYRYGPSFMYHKDGGIDAWFASNSAYGGEWDWFAYKHSDDGGKSWTDEKIVLTPTPGSDDAYSVCDPGAIYFNGYYYLGYTSTLDKRGLNNNGYIARSKNPDGPYEKWNGSGWGGNPSPVIYYDEDEEAWGAGELSFVLKNGTIFCYYTWHCKDSMHTRVSTGDASDKNWPASLTYRGECFERMDAEDSADVIFFEDTGKFVSFSTVNRFSAESGIAVRESKDGIIFKLVDVIRTGISQFCHNMGISKGPDGHVRIKDGMSFIGYAYCDGAEQSWGMWATRIQNISFVVADAEDLVPDNAENGVLRTEYKNNSVSQPKPSGFLFQPRLIEFYIDSPPYYLNPAVYDTDYQTQDILFSKITVTGYDNSIIEIGEAGEVIAKKAGSTIVTAEYSGFHTELLVTVKDRGTPLRPDGSEIAEFNAVCKNVTVSLDSPHKKQIRGRVLFNDGRIGEAYNDTYDLAKVPADLYPVMYEVENGAILEINEKGIIQPLSKGKTTVKMTIEGGKSAVVTVSVE